VFDAKKLGSLSMKLNGHKASIAALLSMVGRNDDIELRARIDAVFNIAQHLPSAQSHYWIPLSVEKAHEAALSNRHPTERRHVLLLEHILRPRTDKSSARGSTARATGRFTWFEEAAQMR